MQPFPLYLAGGLFNAAERLHNTQLEYELNKMGYKTILPQREAAKFLDLTTGKFDVKGIRNDCMGYCKDSRVILIGCLDGADADSGMAMEHGMHEAVGGKSVLYRTDFRTDQKKEIGINGMFGESERTRLIYFPCTSIERTGFLNYYYQLAGRIHGEVQNLWRGTGSEAGA